jgi:molybdate transport system substrate-binding protein
VMIMKRMAILFQVLIVLLMPALLSAEEKLNMAVAANFMQPVQKIAALFEKKTNIKIEATYASTGKLYSQIVNGAPYDVFLAADEERPGLLFRDGLAEKPFIYASGQVILWSAKKEFCQAKNWRDAVQNKKIRKIAIANVKTAPYGAVSMEALKKVGLWEDLQSKMVFAQDIAQSFQYAFTESVDVGFCAFSAAFSEQGKKGCFFEANEAPPVVQAACVVKQTKKSAAARQFADFLNSPDAKAVKTSYGYR